MDTRRALDDLLHELEDGQFGTKMRGYAPAEVDALLERAGRALEDLRGSTRRAEERATLAERQLEEELEAARIARAEAEAWVATAEAEAARIVADARAEAADLRSAAEAEVRVAIEDGRTRMMAEMAEAERQRDRVLEEVEVIAGHVIAHRERLGRAVADLAGLVDGIDVRPDGVRPPEQAMDRAGNGSTSTEVESTDELEPDPLPAPEWGGADVVTPIRLAEALPGKAGSDGRADQSALDAFFADDGS